MIFAAPLQWLVRLRKQFFQLSVVAVMAAIGLWGHKTHWQFSAHANDAFERTDNRESPVTDPATTVSGIGDAGASGAVDGAQKLRVVRFPTAQSVIDIGVAVLPAEHRPLSREILATGRVTFDPNRLAQISARVSGTVWRVDKQVGQTVRAGEVLALIDAPTVGQAKADFLHSLADVELHEKAYERLQSFGSGEVPGKQVAEAATALRKARVDLFNAQQALISLGFSVKLKDWEDMSEDELKRNMKFLGLPPSLIAELDPDSTTATLLPIFAPFTGLVIGRNVTLGEIVSPSESQFEIADVSRVWVVLDVRGQDADALELGQPISFRAGKATVNSNLVWMSTSVDPKTRTVEARAEVDNPEIKDDEGESTGQFLLRANVFGDGKIQLRESPDALVVPTKSVQREGTNSVVFVQIDPQSFEARPVRVGIVTPEFTEILAGLDGSEVVAVEGSHMLKAELLRSRDDMAASP